MSDRTSQLVTTNPEALLRQILDLLQEGCGMLTATETGRLDPYSDQLEDAVRSLQSAAALVDPDRMEAPARERCLRLARRLRRQVGRFDALLNGWAVHLTGWQQVRENHEHGYTASGAPSPALASVALRAEL
jgi:hypothetical protein